MTTIATRRDRLGLTQAQLAELLGISRRQLQNLEAGDRGDDYPVRERRLYSLALEALEARHAAGRLLMPPAAPRGRPRKPQ